MYIDICEIDREIDRWIDIQIHFHDDRHRVSPYHVLPAKSSISFYLAEGLSNSLAGNFTLKGDVHSYPFLLLI